MVKTFTRAMSLTRSGKFAYLRAAAAIEGYKSENVVDNHLRWQKRAREWAFGEKSEAHH